MSGQIVRAKRREKERDYWSRKNLGVITTHSASSCGFQLSIWVDNVLILQRDKLVVNGAWWSRINCTGTDKLCVCKRRFSFCLKVSKNPSLNCWQQIGSLLAAFPRLQCLSMADCNVDTIPEKVADLLPCVQSLNISNWPLNCWIALERLNQMPKLFELRCQGLRLLQKYENLELRRQLLIARLPRVRRLNGSEITDDERLHAERAFIRYYSQCPETPKPKR